MQHHGGPDALLVGQVDRPVPTSGEVLVRVRAAGVNNTDIWTREGSYGTAADPRARVGWRGEPIATPRIQGADVVGVVDTLGDGVDQRLTGQRVLVDPATYDSADPDADPVALIGSESDGGFAEYCVVRADQVHDVSGSPLSDAELAGLPIAYGTAVGMLARADARSGQTVVVTGASGGVGVALVQLSVALGLRVLAVSTADKTDQLTRLGADAVIDRRSPTLVDDIDRAAPHGVHLVADVVGGPLFTAWPGVLARRGRVVVAGGFAGPVVSIDLRRVYLGQQQIIGSTMHTPRHFARLVDLARHGALRPPLAAVFPLGEIHRAQAAIRDPATLGKIVIDPTR